MKFTKKYFENYAGIGKSYTDYFGRYINSPEDLRRFIRNTGRKFPRSIIDLGAADGSALKLFGSVLKSRVLHGVEISDYATKHRIINDIFKLDARQFALNPPQKALSVYDLILVTMLMYVSAAEVRPFLESVKKFCTPDSLILVTLPSPYPWVFYKYVSEHRIQCSGPINVVRRPKPWWIEQVYDAGFEIVDDLGGIALVLSLPADKWTRPRVFGDGSLIEFELFANSEKDSSNVRKLRVLHKESLLELVFEHRRLSGQGRFFEIEGLSKNRTVHNLSESLTDILAFFRSGRVGPDRLITLSKIDQHVYVPGFVYDHKRGGIVLYSDERI